MKSVFRFIRSNKILTKLLSFTLSVIMIFYVIPTVIYGEIAEAFEKEDALPESAAAEAPEADSYTVPIESSYKSELFEVTGLREESAKHFRLEDGSYVAAQYSEPVHYKDENGSWRDINNSLIDSNNYYETSNARIKFEKKITGNSKLFTLHDGSTKLSMALIGAIKKTEGAVTNFSDEEHYTTLQKMMNLENLSSEIIYRDILEGVDLQYVVSSLNVKENIIVKQASENYSYSFELALNGLSAALAESGDVLILSGTDVKYTIPAPITYDVNGVYAESGVSAFTLTDQGNGKYILTVSVDSEWMNSPERAFPVTVDPAIIYSNAHAIDTSISSNNTTTAYGEATKLFITSSRLAHWKTLVLPTITQGKIVNASMFLYNSTLTNGNKIGAYDVITDWDTSLTWEKYSDPDSPEGAISDTPVDYQVITNTGIYQWDITSIVTKWYSGTNYGVAFDKLEGTSAALSFYSLNDATATNRPKLTITYVQQLGLESYWSYNSQSAGLAGNGNVNLATGELVFDIPTLTTTDKLMPSTLSLVYNSSFSGRRHSYESGNSQNLTPTYLPYGFKLNICEVAFRMPYLNSTGINSHYYLYFDADGTIHHFFETTTAGTYTDLEGLLFVLKEEGATVEITDESKTKRILLSTTPEGNIETFILWKIEDVYGNAVNIGYANGKPDTLSLTPAGESSIQFFKLGYNTSGLLSYVYNETAKEAVTFGYSTSPSGSATANSGSYLVQADRVKLSDNFTEADLASYYSTAENANITKLASMHYEYDSEGKLIKASDSRLNNSIEYTWQNGKVVRVDHKAGELSGQSVSISYATQHSKVTSSGNDEVLGTADDVINTYAFDIYGRAVSLYSSNTASSVIYGGTVAEYETQQNVKNNIKEQTVLGGASVNLLLNGDFDDIAYNNPFNHWVTSGSVTASSTKVATGMSVYSAKLSPTVDTPASVTQYVSLPAGKYTLSFFKIASDCKNVSATVKVTSTVGSGFSHTEEIPLANHTYVGVPGFFSTEFELPEYSGGNDKLAVTIEFTMSAATLTPQIFIDDIMLEKSVGASKYTLVEYGTFDASVTSASGSTVSVIPKWDLATPEASITATASPFGNVLKIGAGDYDENYARQRIYVAPQDLLSNFGTPEGTNAGYDFVVAAYALATSALHSAYGKFRIRIDVTYYQGSGNEDVVISHYFDFIPEITDWQFTGGSFSTGYTPADNDLNDYTCVKYIDVYCEFINQAEGYALFDNISVIDATDYSIDRYYYYENGLLAMKQSGLYEEYYYYTADKMIQRVANNRGTLTDYSYTGFGEIAEKEVTQKEYSFTVNSGGTLYPYNSSNPDSLITTNILSDTTRYYNQYGLLTKEVTYNGIINSSLDFTTSYNYYLGDSHIFGTLYSVTDHMHTDIEYIYDETNGNLLTVINNIELTATVYSYDSIGRLISVLPATVNTTTYEIQTITNAERINYTYNANNLLSTVSTAGTTYSFTYDAFGNVSGVNSTRGNILSYTYNENNGKLQKVTYSSGFSEEYVYNDLELLKEIWYNNTNGTRALAYSYEYTAHGQVSKLTDHQSGRAYQYQYNNDMRLVKLTEYDSDMKNLYFEHINYDSYGNVTYVSVGIDYLSRDIRADYYYTYNKQNKITSVRITSTSPAYNVSYSYDAYQRLSSKQYYSGGFSNTVNYTYEEENTYLSGNVKKFESTTNIQTENESTTTYTYTYDGNGNITHILYEDTFDGERCSIYYKYDDIGQLIREDNELQGKTHIHTYDNDGNIISSITYSYTNPSSVPTTTPLETEEYVYTNGLLTSYNGINISYNSSSQPTVYENGTARLRLNWRGDRITMITTLTTYYMLTYDETGRITSKFRNPNSPLVEYHYSGDLLVAEKNPNYALIYLYDADGSPIGFKYVSSTNITTTYFYEKNLQGDIVAVYDQSGTKLISYVYDAWGNFDITYHNGGASTTAIYNPFTYRGYYYDRELKLYYLMSRYYDPVVGRFISADDISYLDPTSLSNMNLYSYCGNNPVMYSDRSGHSPIGVFSQFLVSLWSYVGMAVTSIWDDEVRSDMNAIKWNPFNVDESVVLNSKKVSFYKGAPVFKTNLNRSGSFCAIFLNSSASETTLKHEYGHNIQQMIMGPVKFGAMIGLPSWQQWSSRDYYDRPWEVTADVFGGVTNRTHSTQDIIRGYFYLATSTFFGPFGYFFLFGEY